MQRIRFVQMKMIKVLKYIGWLRAHVEKNIVRNCFSSIGEWNSLFFIGEEQNFPVQARFLYHKKIKTNGIKIELERQDADGFE